MGKGGRRQHPELACRHRFGEGDGREADVVHRTALAELADRFATVVRDISAVVKGIQKV